MQQGEPVLPEGCTSPSWQSCHGAPPHLPVRAPAGIDQAPSKEVDNATSAPSPFTLHARCFVCARLVRAAIGLAEASYAAALADYLRKKKSTLQHGALLECVAKAPGLAAAAQPLAVVAKEAGGAARNAYIQVRPPSHAHTCVCACVCVRVWTHAGPGGEAWHGLQAGRLCLTSLPLSLLTCASCVPSVPHPYRPGC